MRKARGIGRNKRPKAAEAYRNIIGQIGCLACFERENDRTGMVWSKKGKWSMAGQAQERIGKGKWERNSGGVQRNGKRIGNTAQ